MSQQQRFLQSFFSNGLVTGFTSVLRAGLRIKENKEVYEGEVIELTPEEAESQTGGYGKVIASVVIGLKTVKARWRTCVPLCTVPIIPQSGMLVACSDCACKWKQQA